MGQRLSLLLLLLAVGCSAPGPFVQRPTTTATSPRVLVQNESPGAVYVTFEGDSKHKIDVAPWSETYETIPAGTYGYQIFIEGRGDFPAKWFSHGPRGAVTFQDLFRYTWRWRKKKDTYQNQWERPKASDILRPKAEHEAPN